MTTRKNESAEDKARRLNREKQQQWRERQAEAGRTAVRFYLDEEQAERVRKFVARITKTARRRAR